MNAFTTFLCITLNLAPTTSTGEKILYQNDFKKAHVGTVPKEFLVLLGEFKVREAQDNRWLELPGSPLETFGVLFGPVKREGVLASARIRGMRQGRSTPTFGVGLNGVGGFLLKVNPSRRSLELYQGDRLLQQASFRWKSGQWTHLVLQVRQTGKSRWLIQGKAWSDGLQEPEPWTLQHTIDKAPLAGRAAIFGSPYSGKPIQFDDLTVRRLSTGS